MSTRPPPCRAAARLAPIALLVGACQGVVTDRLATLCRTSGVIGVPVTLVVDTVAPGLGWDALRVAAERWDIGLTLVDIERPGVRECAEEAGEGTFDASLPPQLADAVAERERLSWRVAGTEVAVNLNPGEIRQALLLYLPLQGDTGRWVVRTPRGDVAAGRVFIEEP